MKKVTAGIVGLLVVFGLVAYSKGGNERQADADKYSLRWETNKIDLSIPGETLRISLPLSGDSYPWIIGINVDDSQRSFANVMQVQVDDFGNAGIKRPSAVVNVPHEKMAVTPGTVSLKQGASGNENLILYLVVPSGKKLVLQNEAKGITQFDIKTDTIIQNGVISSQEVRGLQNLIPRLLTAHIQAPASSSEVLKSGTGKFMALPQSIRSHLVSSVRPQFEASGSEGIVLVKFEVDENGKVIEVSSSASNEKLALACIEAVKKWTFIPYEHEGKKVRVNASVSFYDDGRGRIISAALGDAR